MAGLSSRDIKTHQAETLDFTATLNMGWYNYCGSEMSAADPRAASLSQCQSLEHELDCGTRMSQNGKPWTSIARSEDTRLVFAVGGGAEIPCFKLKLTLYHPQTLRDSHTVMLVGQHGVRGNTSTREALTALGTYQASRQNTLSLADCGMSRPCLDVSLVILLSFVREFVDTNGGQSLGNLRTHRIVSISKHRRRGCAHSLMTSARSSNCFVTWLNRA
ncbi:uncharacterized protein BJX67DRAFT_342313 [Aspergillus lucknowensis]|uniref:Uncharacterized protein n=1 Tax=Aspergillus lucknowensis TaxID=176173 RepID=A0ABR4M4E2_9EURO